MRNCLRKRRIRCANAASGRSEIEAAQKKHEAVAAPLNEELEKMGDSFDKEIILRLIKLKSEDKAKEFEKAQADLEEAMKNAMEWIQTRPEQNEKNTKIFNEHKAKIEALRDKTQQMVLDALSNLTETPGTVILIP